jgi:DNA-binding response OmpR family regulator
MRSKIDAKHGCDCDLTQLLLVTQSAPLSECLMRTILGRPRWRSIHVVDVAAALASISDTYPRVVVVDDELPHGSTAIEACQRIRATSVSLGLIVTTSSDKVEERLLAFDAGADDCLVKPLDLRELWARIQVLARRSARNDHADVLKPCTPPERAPSALELRTMAFAAHHRLSERESEILLHILRGIHLKDIGDRVGSAYSSVRTHVRRMTMKLGCSGSRELVLKFFADDLAGAHASVQ